MQCFPYTFIYQLQTSSNYSLTVITLMNKTTLKNSLSLLAFAAMTLLASCSHDDFDHGDSRTQRTDINNYVYALPSVQQINPFKERPVNDGQSHEVGLNMQQYRPTRAY